MTTSVPLPIYDRQGFGGLLVPALRSGDGCTRRHGRAAALEERLRQLAALGFEHAADRAHAAVERGVILSACASDMTARERGSGAPYASVAIRACTSVRAPASWRT